MPTDPGTQLMEKCVTQLAEHFGAVQIVASRLNPNNTTQSTHRGSGDWYARKALCEEFVEMDQADTLARTINQQTPPEGEEWKRQ